MPRSTSTPRRSRNRSRAWCFTVHWNDRRERYDKRPHWKPETMKYIIVGKEVAPETGAKHLQCYVYYKEQVSFASLHEKYRKVHFERANGSAKQNKIYCSKEGDFKEHGKLPQQGKRNDITDAYEDIAKGKTWRQMVAQHHVVMVKYRRGLQWVKDLHMPKRNWKMEVLIYYGDPGCGKTRLAYEAHEEDVFFKSKGKWWDHYTGQETVIIDDFDPTQDDWKFNYWLTLTDRYPMFIERKGGSTQFCSKRIIITSNYAPTLWFNDRMNRAAFFRRVSKVFHVVDNVAIEEEVNPGPRLIRSVGTAYTDTSAPQIMFATADTPSTDLYEGNTHVLASFTT